MTPTALIGPTGVIYDADTLLELLPLHQPVSLDPDDMRAGLYPTRCGRWAPASLVLGLGREDAPWCRDCARVPR